MLSMWAEIRRQARAGNVGAKELRLNRVLARLEKRRRAQLIRKHNELWKPK
jgi:hypothetical protein